MRTKIKYMLPLAAMTAFAACSKDDVKNDPGTEINEDPSTFAEIGTIDIGEGGAAEISAYDPATKRLFVVKNDGTNMIRVLDLSDPSKIVDLKKDILTNGGNVNSVAVSNGKLAAAIEAANKTLAGRVDVYNTSDLSLIKTIPTGALPDMVTFSPDGKLILTANEGEPATDYSADPAGSVSIINIDNNYAAVQLDFSGFASKEADLKAKGFRVFGPGTSFAAGIEPEYITVAPDSKTAWVTLQENNAIAKIDLASKTITDIFPLGFKDYNTDANAIDVSDKDGAVAFKKWPVKGMYQPDAIAVLVSGSVPHLFTANEGDVREWDAYAENKRIKDIALDPAIFPNAAELKNEAALGRLYVTKTLGDANNDGLYEALYSFGARSFSVWNGNTGAQVYDSRNELDVKAKEAGMYEDGRSDDKSIEPEGIALGVMGKKNVAFVGMERIDAVAVYDVTNPAQPQFLQILKTGDAPEGVLFVAAKDSPTKKSLLIVSSEDDGVIKVYTPRN